ncbi:MAG: hypothetical protein HOV87_33000 [Catenulispora sp.]|nr:hypothetical protein [Catenulispora sp.]
MVGDVGAEAARAVVVIVGGHEDGARVAVDPLAEYGPPLRAASARLRLDEAVRQALDSTDLPVCVVPMTLGRDPRLVADTARTLRPLSRGAAAGRVAMAEPFGNAALLTGWLRTAVAGAGRRHGVQHAGKDGEQHSETDLAILLTANAANRFDDAELFRIAHLVTTRPGGPRVEVAFRGSGSGTGRGSGPGLAEGVERCRRLGARRIAVIPADFGPATDIPMPEVLAGGPLLAPSAVSGTLATRIAEAMVKLSKGDDGIAAGMDADHGHGHGGARRRTPARDAH